MKPASAGELQDYCCRRRCPDRRRCHSRLAIDRWLIDASAKRRKPSRNRSSRRLPQEQAPVSTFGEPSASNTTQKPQAESPSTATEPPVTEAPAANTSAQSKQKKPTATPAKTPEKKKVTVDDLINDN